MKKHIGMSINPDPKKYAIRFRKGKPILVDRQIIAWRRARKRLLAASSASRIAKLKKDMDRVAKMPLNLFEDDI